MKIEKINDNKFRITLSFDELTERNISLLELSKDSSKAQQIFFNIFEETKIDEDFLSEDAQLLVEATTTNDDFFILTVTKITEDIIPDLTSYKKNKNKTTYKVASNIFFFNSLDRILDFSNFAQKNSLYLGLNSLYKYNNKYIVIFKPSTVANKKFLKTFILISEYCEKYYNNNIILSAIKEKGSCIINYRALQKLEF